MAAKRGIGDKKFDTERLVQDGGNVSKALAIQRLF
jgi:hypothetical protein